MISSSLQTSKALYPSTCKRPQALTSLVVQPMQDYARRESCARAPRRDCNCQRQPSPHSHCNVATLERTKIAECHGQSLHCSPLAFLSSASNRRQVTPPPGPKPSKTASALPNVPRADSADGTAAARMPADCAACTCAIAIRLVPLSSHTGLFKCPTFLNQSEPTVYLCSMLRSFAL